MQEKPVVFVISQDPQTIAAIEAPFAGGNMVFAKAENVNRVPSQAKLLSPDVVILDDVFDGTDWFTIYERLMSELSFTFVPILLLLDPGRVDDAVAKMQAGLVDILVKPPKPAELRARLKAMLQVKGIHDQMDEERIVLQRKLEDERRLREQLTAINEELKRLSTTDGLTGLANYRYMRNWLTTEFEIATRYALPLSAIMLDIDNFKAVNDEHGHPFGDFVLKGIADIIRGQARRADFAARYGGEEFAIVLPNTDGQAGINLARRIHNAINKHTFDDGAHQCHITTSIGISNHPADGVRTSEDLIDLADRALYAAKAKGRNRIVSWHEMG